MFGKGTVSDAQNLKQVILIDDDIGKMMLEKDSFLTSEISDHIYVAVLEMHAI